MTTTRYNVVDVNNIINDITTFDMLDTYIDDISTYKKDFTMRTLKHISEYNRKQYEEVRIDDNKTKRNYVYISNYAQKYLESKKEVDDLQQLIREFIAGKVKLKDKDIMDSKLPEQFLYVYVKSTNLKSFQEQFLLMPSYIGWKSDRPTLRHFVLPNETALTKDEFISKNIEIAKDELFDLYKVKLYLDEYIYKFIEFDKIKQQNNQLKKIINTKIKEDTYVFKNNYDDILKYFKEQFQKKINAYFTPTITTITKTDFDKMARDILSDLLNKDNNKFKRREFIVDIDKEPVLLRQLKKSLDSMDVNKYIDRLNNIDPSKIKKNISNFNDMLKYYNDIPDKKLFLTTLEEVLTTLEGSPSIDEKEKKEIIRLKEEINQLKQSKEEVYERMKAILNREMKQSDITVILNNMDKIPYTRTKEIFSLLDRKIIEMRENAKTLDEKLEFTQYIKKSVEKQEGFKYISVETQFEENGELREQIVLNTDLKERIKNEKGNTEMKRKLIENINKYMVKQTINKMLQFDFDVNSIIKIINREGTSETIKFILETIIDINIQMRKINSIASKGQNIRIMLFKDVVELLLNKIVKGRKLMATRDFYFIIKDVKWSPKERKVLNSEEQSKIGMDKKAYQIEISLVLSIEGRSDTSLAFERKCNENQQAIGQIWNEFYGGLKNAVNTKLDELEEKRRKLEEIDCKNIADLSIQGMKQCLIKSKKSQPLDMYFEFSIPKIYGKMPIFAKMPESKSTFTGMEVEFPIRNTMVYDE